MGRRPRAHQDLLRLSACLGTQRDPLHGRDQQSGSRVWEHKQKVVPGFTKTHSVDRLVWFEVHNSIEAAITRETQIKRWKRDWKLDLFRETNPRWDDLYPAIASS